MAGNDVLILIALSAPAKPKDANGFDNPFVETATTVFAHRKSVGYSEFYKADLSGYKAEAKFDVYQKEYDGQEIAEYNGKRFRVLRDYGSEKMGDMVELTLVDLPTPQKPGGGGVDG